MSWRLCLVWVYIRPAVDKTQFRRVEDTPRDYLLRFPVPWLRRKRGGR